ncbi:hypothetical protein EDB84DRAFT_1485522 [Lactarius hengduanensis]|nr:hypothetical protein EDB84DRAFT_1485522 [Lactarius hengduanensis]
MSVPVNSVDGLATQFMVTHILTFTPYSIIYYDYFLTLSDEVELFWLHPDKFNLFSYLFLFNRYVSFFGNLQILIFGLIGRIDFILQSCRASHIYHMVLLLVQQTVVGVLCVMQIHAIYQSRRVLVFLISIAVIGVAVACWSMYALSTDLPYPVVISSVLGCSRVVGETEGFYSAISWTGCLVLDTTVFALLLYETVRVGRGVRLLDTMMRNATVYYSILSLVNLSNILMLRYASSGLRTSTIALTNALSCTLISRIIFDLRSKFGRTSRAETTMHYDQDNDYEVPDERTERSGLPL